MTRHTLRGVLVVLLVLLLPTSTHAQDVAGQKPMLLVGDQFQFAPGHWATYVLHDKRDDTYSTMTMAVLESVRRGGRDCAWLEITVETATDLVVTRILAEKTPSGPGELFEAIVYVHGLRPFRIPQRWLKGEEQQVATASRSTITARVAQRTITFGGQRLEVIDVEATDETGASVAATVSAGVAPLGVLTADSDDIGMYLEGWGSGATTRIVGTPVSFVEWTTTMVARGLSGRDVTLPTKPERTVDMTGVWKEADGPCAGSQWTFTGTYPAAADVTTTTRCDGRGAETTRATGQRWRSDRMLTLTLAEPHRGAGHVLLAFTSASSAIVVYVDRAGRRTVATLGR